MILFQHSFCSHSGLLRTKVGDKIPLKNFYKNKVYDLDVVYHGNETIEVKAVNSTALLLNRLFRKADYLKAREVL